MDNNKVVAYFSGDAMASDAWRDKYQMKDRSGNPMEETPADMHMRMAKEFARIEYSYAVKEFNHTEGQDLSEFGKQLFNKRNSQTEEDIVDEFFSYFNKFSQIVPQGSIMSNLGNKYVFGSLSNCFGIEDPEDSYGGIFRADQEIAQLMKRRGGVGLGLDNLRPTEASVSNSAKSSSGVPSFMRRYSNTTREVAQEGRRGALMELLLVKHPDIFKFVSIKDDPTEVTGANISVKFTDEFMYAVENDSDFLCTFPTNIKEPIFTTIKAKDGSTIQSIINPVFDLAEYNKLYNVESDNYGKIYIMKIHATELFNLVVDMAHKNAEPGVAYLDTIQDYSPDGVYEMYLPNVCNPCAEQWFHAYDTCRLIAINMWGFVLNSFKDDSSIDLIAVYEVAYMQQRLGDNLVDLEVEYIDRIIDKIKSDPQDEETKRVELNLWIKIRAMALAGRRTGGGFTGLGDMIAGINLQYQSDVALGVVEKVMKEKMRGELDATIDMAILRGTFEGWDCGLEFQDYGNKQVEGTNSFFKMIKEEFPQQAKRMYLYGRRNVSWSTVAPTGTVSLMTQTTSGLEPLFKAYYIRRKKINPSEAGSRVDFTDQSGDTWQEYAVLHPKFKEWIKIYMLSNITLTDGLLKDYKLQMRDVDQHLLDEMIEFLDRDKIQEFFKLSPWYGSEADDIAWEDRIRMNAVIQKYTSNAISCTINLPKDIDKSVVKNIYLNAWKKGLKGVTVYRDGSRSGVLVTDKTQTTVDKFGYRDAPKRPRVLDADYHYVTSRGNKYAVIVGKLEGHPYEVFAFENPLEHKSLKGTITKIGRGHYEFMNCTYKIENLQLSSEFSDEKLLTRWTSQLLRHGANPKFIVEQIEKSEVIVTSFARAVARVLKTYIPNEEVVGEICSNCGEATIIYQEGCKRCSSCGNSKC